MTTPQQLAELEQRHADLEQQIAEAMTHPSADTTTELAELKRRKLHIKDEIARLKGDMRVH